MRRRLIAALALAATCVLAAGCSTTQQGAPAPTPTTTRPPAPPVAATSLDGLLLSPDQINAAMGATAMTLKTTTTTLDDFSAHVADPACRSLYALPSVRWTAYLEQQLKDPGVISSEIGPHIMVADFAHYADQAVTLFPSAEDAHASFTANAQRFPACANR